MNPATVASGLLVSFLLATGTAAAQDRFPQTSPQPPRQPTAPQQPPQNNQQQTEPQVYPQQPQLGEADALTRMERQDLGVQPTSRLHSGAMHGPTPASIPGGQLITTKDLAGLLQGSQSPVLLLDVLGGPELIPGAQYAVPAHQAGSFDDQTQAQFGQFLQQATSGSKEHLLVLYCQSVQCWMSYNAALRAINLGYTNVLWYRGGLDAWKQGGQPVQQAQRGHH